MKIERAANELKKLYSKEPWFTDVVLVETHFGKAIQVQYKWVLNNPIVKLSTFHGHHVHWLKRSP
jgi:hypothetical protein